MSLPGWQEQIARDQAFLARVVPFTLVFLGVILEVHGFLHTSWAVAFAAGLAGGLLAAVASVRWGLGGIVSLLAILRLLLIVLREQFS